MRVKCLTQEHNAVSPARAGTWTARSGDECTSHEATAPPITSDISDVKSYNGLEEQHFEYAVLVILIYAYISSAIDVDVYP